MRNDNSKGKRKFGSAGMRTQDTRVGQLEVRRQLPRILIVCEGTKTEPNYFRSFRVTNDIYGEGIETMRVVEEAMRLNDKEGPFTQIWCVFDRDDFPAQNFDNAIHMVQSRESTGFRIAYSNESFELWYLLHFEYLDAAVRRTHYIEKLHKLIGRNYEKGDTEIYATLQQVGNEDLAMRYAQRLREMHGTDKPCSQRCPETTVDLLVKALRAIQIQHQIEMNPESQ
ncbi:MAG: abortive phage infection protein [Chthonomonadales bacterium]|nr:abortive phage infection protein [Chthonomonadales bacterium]